MDIISGKITVSGDSDGMELTRLTARLLLYFGPHVADNSCS